MQQQELAGSTSSTLPPVSGRCYVRAIFGFAAKFYKSNLPPSLNATWSFATPAPVQPLVEGAPLADEAGRTLHMDFKNYTLGTRATITLCGVDGLDADILYVREDLLRQYAGERAIVWFAFGERELRPYQPSPPEWLEEALRHQANTWCDVLTDADIMQ